MSNPLPETQPDESGAQPVAAPTSKSRRALSRLKRELTEEELATSGVQKMLLEEIERVQEEVNELRLLQAQYHTADKAVAVLTEKLRTKLGAEIISAACLTVGAAAIGYSR